MLLFHGSNSSKKAKSALTHYGSLNAAIGRVTGIFARTEPFAYDGHTVFVLNYDQSLKRTESTTQLLARFADRAQQAIISEYDVKIKNPLRLRDTWTDDPIGSGGMTIFLSSDLPKEKLEELEDLFSPFKGMIYPTDIALLLNPRCVQEVFNRYKSNALFQEEFAKRQRRSIAIGEDFAMAANWETVWLDLTLKLRTWALQNGYDSFVYENNAEDDSQDSYVALKNSQSSSAKRKLVLDRDKFLSAVSPIFEEYMRNQWEESKELGKDQAPDDVFWAGHSPSDFWIPKSRL